MKAMAYIKKTACDDMSLSEFTAEWNAMTPDEQEQLREWAREEGKVVGVDVD